MAQEVQTVEGAPKRRVAPWPKLDLRAAVSIGSAAAAVAFIVLALFFLPGYLVEKDIGGRRNDRLTTAELLKAKNDVRSTLLQAVGGLILLAGAVFTWRQLRLGREQLEETQRQNREQLRLSREEQITERFTRAIDQLGSDKLDVRLGGIYALERIAKDSHDDHGPVMEVLTAFLREHARPQEASVTSKPDASRAATQGLLQDLPADVQAAATVFGRRDAARDPPDHSYDLSQVELPGVSLAGATLRGSILAGANLTRASLIEADLQAVYLEGAILEGALLARANLQWLLFPGGNLRQADLAQANLQEAQLSGAELYGGKLGGASLRGSFLVQGKLRFAHLADADLTGVDLRGADLTGADLSGADLTGADLSGADLTGADLSGADVTRADLSGAELTRANFRNADLTRAGLGGADLSQAQNLTREQLDKAVTTGATKVRLRFDEAREETS